MLSEDKNTAEINEIDIENEPPYKRYPRFQDWMFRLVLFLVGFLVLDIFTLIVQVIIQLLNPNLVDSTSEFYVTGLAIINTIRYTVLVLVFVAMLFPRLGIIFKKFLNLKKFGIGIGMGAATIFATAVYGIILHFVMPVETNNNEVLAESMIKVYPIVSIVVLGIIGPFCEEVTYRYGLFGCINKKNRILAYIITILVFSLIHFDFTGNMRVELLNLPSYLIAGFLLTFTYERFGFEASVIAHITNNLFSIIVTIYS